VIKAPNRALYKYIVLYWGGIYTVFPWMRRRESSAISSAPDTRDYCHNTAAEGECRSERPKRV
jgi:hypothetical protein